ncbi:MAG: dihydrolipoamide dehydrogenase [Hyphomicrobiales bacterium]|nr:dihydrolipoamide dehydrogenase [Hyphomicrobiales bacterium]
MSDVLKPDLCVIGAGSGGLSVAAAAAAMGVPVVLVEKGEMGGDCLNYGCVPSKALIAAARTAQTVREAGRFGVEAVEPRVSMAEVRAHVRHVVAAVAPNDSEARYRAMGVQVIRASARFVSPRAVEAGGVRIEARRFVVATGSSPAAPAIPGLDQIRPLTNETIFDLDVLPARLAIVGAGPIGVELAQAFRRLGCEVTLLESGRALAQEDPELAAPALEALVREGVQVREGVSIARFEAHGAGARIVLAGPGGEGAEEFVDASHVLLATGRTANVHGLGLEQAGVEFDARGVKVSQSLRTSNRRVYAVGDAAASPSGEKLQFTHAANYHAGLVLRAALFRLPVRMRPERVPRVTYSDPEIAVAGLTEAQARKLTHKLHVYRWPFSENDRAQAERRTAGFVKVVVAPGGRVLGAGIVGAHAGELIAVWQLAIARGMKIGEIADVVLPYPTLAEVSRRVAISHYARSLGGPSLQSLLRFLRRFG